MWLIEKSKTVLLTTTLHLDTTARLAMAFTDNGCNVAALCPPGHWVNYISRISGRLRYSSIRPLHALERAIRRVQPDIVIPCDDRAVRHMHALLACTRHADVRRRLLRSLGCPDVADVTVSRAALMTKAVEIAVPAPKTKVVTDVSDLMIWMMDSPFPWVIKADGTWAGAGVRIVRSLAEAETAFHEMSQPVGARTAISEALLDWDFFWIKPWLRRQTQEITVQQYVDGYPANCAVAAVQGEIVGFTAVEVVRAESPTGPACVVRLVENPQMLDTASKITRALGFTGLCGFDFIIDAATNVPHLIEMNPRNVPLCHIALGPGRDMVEAITAHLEGRAVRARRPVTHQDMITYFPFSWQRDHKDPVLNAGYQDVPWEEEQLLVRLLQPAARERKLIRGARRLLRIGSKGQAIALP